MSEDTIPMKLLEARDEIDKIDRQLIELLAERFVLTREVGLIKASSSLEAMDPEREARKLEAITQLCREKGLNTDFVTGIFQQIMAEVVKNHRSLRGTENG